MTKTYILYGPPGSGKTTISRLIANNLDMQFYDLDEIIESKAGMSIAEIFRTDGEAAFRNMESLSLMDLLTSHHGVVALGGGALLGERNRQIAEFCGTVICLNAQSHYLIERAKAQSNVRPLLGSDDDIEKRMASLLTARQDHYASFTNRLDTSTFSIEETAWKVQTQFGAFRVVGMGSAYDVYVQYGAIENLVKMMGRNHESGSICIATDTNVAQPYADQIKTNLAKAGYKVDIVVLPAGENTKSIHFLETLWEEFLSAGLERSSVVVALGGGVIGDLSGFAAATYMRGIPWIGIPTSLLAMVNSSLGGKTGINLKQGKNLAGVFHAPKFVLADPQMLSTLPGEELRNGLAEIVKHAVLADPNLFMLLASGWVSVTKHLEEVVKRAVAVKIKYITADPYEKGVRAALNFGHTLAHALEKGSGYQLRHGEAVAIGMVYETKLAEKLGIAQIGLSEQISEVLGNLGLLVNIPTGFDKNQLLQDIQFDKKKKDGDVRFALPVKIGEVQHAVVVKEEEIKWMIAI